MGLRSGGAAGEKIVAQTKITVNMSAQTGRIAMRKIEGAVRVCGSRSRFTKRDVFQGSSPEEVAFQARSEG